MPVIRSRVSIAMTTASLVAVAACGLPDRVRGLLGGEEAEVQEASTQDEPDVEAEDVTLADAAKPAPSAGGLGATVAGLVPQPGAPRAEPGPHGADLDLVEKIHVTRLEAGWTNKPKSSHGAVQGVVFEIDADVKVDADVGINQARLVAKATCQVDDERRASAAEVYSPNPTPWGGYDYVSAEPGEHEKAWAHLFTSDNVVGRTPCQVEFRLTSPLSDKPMRVAGTWCVRDSGTEAAPCPELPPVAPAKGITVRDWEFDRSQQMLEITVQTNERVWLDRDLVVRSSCDRGGERLPRMVFAYGSWSFLDPGDSARVMLSRYDGWFGADPPCELTLEWWRRDDRGNRLDPTTDVVACVRKFLPEEGPCGDAPKAVSGAASPLTVRKFAPSVTRDPYNRRYRHLVADVELFANEDIDGRWNLEVKGHCGKGRGRQDVWMSPDLNVEPRMLKANEVALGTMRGWMASSASSCELELQLTPQTAGAATPTSLGKHCVTKSGSKPC
jgi:hypothetical protein